MKFLVAFVVFVLGLIFGAPFVGALVMGAAAWLIVHFAQKGSAQAPSPITPAEPARAPEPPTSLDDFPSLRSYVEKLASRVQALEREVASLKGGPVPTPVVEKPEPPAPKPVAERPVEDVKPVPVPPVVKPAVPQPPLAQPPAKQVSPARPAPEESSPGPEEPSLISRLFAGNIVAKVGAIVLFFGVSEAYRAWWNTALGRRAVFRRQLRELGPLEYLATDAVNGLPQWNTEAVVQLVHYRAVAGADTLNITVGLLADGSIARLDVPLR